MFLRLWNSKRQALEYPIARGSSGGVGTSPADYLWLRYSGQLGAILELSTLQDDNANTPCHLCRAGRAL
jgi:hypothetical protein